MLWKKIITISRPWGDQDVPLSKGNGEAGRGRGRVGSPCKPKSFNFPLLLDKNITYSNNITYNKSYPIAKKSPLIDLNLLQSKVSSFFPIKQQFSSNHPMQSLFVAAVISLVSFFKFQALKASQKHWMTEWWEAKQNFHSLPPMLFENSASIIAYFPLFHIPFFISHFVKFQLTPLQLGFCGFWANQI